ncbi:MAG: hypothetical protein K2H60_16835 [Muribaculaceae bacterium]|nr:hypothetical protein [Muribaculaceae bacterium]
MSIEKRYRILWIEDDPKVVMSYKASTSEIGIDFVQYDDWESASKYMDQFFDEIDAIIFDAHCKIKKGDTVANDDFLHIAVVEMLLKFAKFHSVRPWYILSAGTMERFDKVIPVIRSYRRDYEDEWGELVYTKTNPEPFANEYVDPIEAMDKPANETDLLNQILKVCSEHVHNMALARHRDTLQYLGSHALIKGNARKFMLQLLSAMYEPQKYIGFTFSGNPIRRVFECIVHAGVEFGIIPDCVIEGVNVKCSEASRFLCGVDPIKLPYRYGNRGDSVFDYSESSMLKTILQSTNISSHESADDYIECEVTLGEDNRDEYSGCTLLMCRIIKAFGKYVSTHRDYDTNRRLWRPNAKSYENHRGVLKKSGTEWYVDECLVKYNRDFHEGDTLELKSIVLNNNPRSSLTFFAHEANKIISSVGR